jgi:hypothetical protein
MKRSAAEDNNAQLGAKKQDATKRGWAQDGSKQQDTKKARLGAEAQ